MAPQPDNKNIDAAEEGGIKEKTQPTLTDHEELPGNDKIFLEDIWGLVQTVSAVPDWIPKKFIDQFAIYKNGATIRYYIYDATNGAWRYAVLI